MTEPNDPHILWEQEDGSWMTDYPPPADFDGEEEGEYGDRDYRRTLSPAEQDVIDAERAEDRAFAEEQRDRHFWPERFAEEDAGAAVTDGRARLC